MFKACTQVTFHSFKQMFANASNLFPAVDLMDDLSVNDYNFSTLPGAGVGKV